MRRLIKPLILIGAWAGSYVGMRYETWHVQQTCEADVGATWLNGTPYVCLSQRHIDIMRGHREQGA